MKRTKKKKTKTLTPIGKLRKRVKLLEAQLERERTENHDLRTKWFGSFDYKVESLTAAVEDAASELDRAANDAHRF